MTYYEEKKMKIQLVSNRKDKDKYSNKVKQNDVNNVYIVGSLYSLNYEEIISFE